MIGFFDSGVGGLAILKAARPLLPQRQVLYFGDNAHIPYGPRPAAEVRSFAEGITRFLLARGARLIVVACNAASVVALKYLRRTFPHIPFVGVEPPVKPAAEQSRSGVIGVLATVNALEGKLFQTTVRRWAGGKRVVGLACSGLVEQIEAGQLTTPETEAMLRSWLEPLLAQGVDAVALGCTHYIFVRPLVEKICGPAVKVIDPAAAVAQQIKRLADGAGAAPTDAAPLYYTTGSVAAFHQMLAYLDIEPREVRRARWEGLTLAEDSDE